MHFLGKEIYGVNLQLLLNLKEPCCTILSIQLKSCNYDDQHMGSKECISPCGVSVDV